MDDITSVRGGLRHLLSAAGFVVLTSATIERALQVLQEKAVDVVVADLKLAGYGAPDGLDLLAAVERWHPGVTRVLATADPDGPELARMGRHFYFDKGRRISDLALLLRVWVPRAT